ncbi:MAG: efflux RND transporter periplasmic adaptor subunit [Bacteroidia bacterium]|nr:efflux RND transporter periplasmic adaptor subunit [Bacteroidia bacterium]
MSALFLALSGCGSGAPSVEEQPVSYQVVNPIRIDTTYYRAYVADIQSTQHIELRARISGYLERLHVDEGQTVREGQLLFTISNREYQEAFRQAQAALGSITAEARVAAVELQNTRILAEKNIISASEVDIAQAHHEALLARVEEAEAAVSHAKLNLAFTEVRAPFSGVINRIPYKAGSLLNQGDMLTTLSGSQEVFAYFSVSEQEYLRMQSEHQSGGRQVMLQLANGENYPSSGRVETAESVIDKRTGSLAFRARFPNPDQLLKHGASGKVLVYETLKNVLIVPQKSTFDVQDKTYVFVVNDSNIAERRAIVPSLRLGDLYVVESGLSLTDRMIYEGIQQVQEGTKVESHLVPFRQVMHSLASK